MEITRKTKKYLINTLKQYRMVQTSRKQNSGELAYSKRIELKTDLTTEEKNRIKALWGEIVPNIKSGYLAYKIYKQLHGFDERFVPVPYYYPYIMMLLLNLMLCQIAQNIHHFASSNSACSSIGSST